MNSDPKDSRTAADMPAPADTKATITDGWYNSYHQHNDSCGVSEVGYDGTVESYEHGIAND